MRDENPFHYLCLPVLCRVSNEQTSMEIADDEAYARFFLNRKRGASYDDRDPFTPFVHRFNEVDLPFETRRFARARMYLLVLSDVEQVSDALARLEKAAVDFLCDTYKARKIR